MSILRWFRWVLYLWPLPCTIIGLAVGLLAGRGPRHTVVRRGTLGVYGPAIERVLKRAPIVGGAAAMTLGHVILACDKEAFDLTFEHEWIHVKQYLWWGPLFFPAYAASSFWQWICKRNAYLDNAFEVHARRHERRNSHKGSR